MFCNYFLFLYSSANRPCATGTKTITEGSKHPGEEGFDQSLTIEYGRTFDREPEVIVSVAGFTRAQQMKTYENGDKYAYDTWWDFRVEVASKSTTSFGARFFVDGTNVPRLSISWIACQ